MCLNYTHYTLINHISLYIPKREYIVRLKLVLIWGKWTIPVFVNVVFSFLFSTYITQSIFQCSDQWKPFWSFILRYQFLEFKLFKDSKSVTQHTGDWQYNKLNEFLSHLCLCLLLFLSQKDHYSYLFNNLLYNATLMPFKA